MGLQKTIAWSVVSGATLIAVALLIEQPLLRAVLALLAASPLCYVAVGAAVRSKRIAERRAYLGLRQATDEFLVQVRNLNRLKVIAESDQELQEAEEMIEEVVAQMHDLVERIRELAGRPGPPPPRADRTDPGSASPGEAQTSEPSATR